MESRRNSLDLNSLPEEYEKGADDAFTAIADSMEDTILGVEGLKKKQREGKDEHEKIYECRFCFLKFSKSQALGGHMNRHRQERETETLNRARELVFSNDNIAAVGSHLGLGGNGYFQQPGSTGDPLLPFRSVYPEVAVAPRPIPFSASPSQNPFQTQQQAHPTTDHYYVGRLVPGSWNHQLSQGVMWPPPPSKAGHTGNRQI